MPPREVALRRQRPLRHLCVARRTDARAGRDSGLGRRVLRARRVRRRDVKAPFSAQVDAGEELTYDYRWRTFEVCRCGAPSCVGVMDGQARSSPRGRAGPGAAKRKAVAAARAPSADDDTDDNDERVPARRRPS